MLITLAKMRDKASIAKLYLLILCSLLGGITRIMLFSLFLIFIKSSYIVSTVIQLALVYITFH